MSFIDKHSGPDRRTVLIIDEFPFLAEQNPSIKSIFQHTIDHSWQNKNIFLIFCGSSVSFMINEIMGYKSPLYGRITSHLEVRPFDYLESPAFFPDYSQEEKLLAYGILGGIPRYLRAFNPSQSITENIAGHILSENSYLHDEPQSHLRMELRSRYYTTASLRPSPMEQIRLPPFLTVSTKTAANAQNICKYCKISAS